MRTLIVIGFLAVVCLFMNGEAIKIDNQADTVELKNIAGQLYIPGIDTLEDEYEEDRQDIIIKTPPAIGEANVYMIKTPPAIGEANVYMPSPGKVCIEGKEIPIIEINNQVVPIVSIAVCDTRRIVDEYKFAQDTKAALAKLDADIKQARQNVANLAKSIKDKEAELEAMRRKSGKKYEALVSDIANAKAGLKVFQETRARELSDQQAKVKADMVASEDNTRAAIDKIAKDKGVNLVLSKQQNIVLYADDTLDITNDVIAELNKDVDGEE